MCPDELYNTIFFKSGADPCLPYVLATIAHARRARKGRMSRCPKDGARQNINASSVSYRPRSQSVALARSRSISLSSSPDKSETEVVEIARNPYRVHQTEHIRRQYSSLLTRPSNFFISISQF